MITGIKKVVACILTLTLITSNIPIVTATAAEDYRQWAQSDSRWGSIRMGSSSETISSAGCLVTSVSKLMVQAGVKNASSFNVATFANWLNSNSGYIPGGGLIYAKVTEYSGLAYYGNLLSGSAYNSSSYNSTLLNWIKQGYHMVIGVKGNGHWVAVDEAKSLQTGQIYIMDSLKGSANADITLSSRYSTFNTVHAYTGGKTPSANSTPNFTVNLSNDQILRGNSVPITGTVSNGGTYPWLELYMDYAYVSTTCNNSYGNYAFYLDTTQYSDGKHLLGVKMRNEDGFDYTAWYNIIINNSGSIADEYSVDNISDGTILNGNSAPILGRVFKGGTYPWLELYMDYAYVSTTANNTYGNYAFYLDTTQYSDGEHLLGVKMRNEDGYNYTTWYNVIIDNTGPEITNVTVSDVSETGYTISCSVSDNSSIDKVLFPTWTNYNEQDDLDQNWRNIDFYKGEINGDVVTYRVNTSDHNDETGYYITHIYAYDTLGNYSVANAKIAVCTEVYSPSNETIYNGNKYVLFDEKIYAWNQAKTYCESIGGHLVTITSQEEEDIVKGLIENGSSEGYWIGATDEASEGNWKWVTGESFDYGDWGVNQPDNSEGNQDYLTIRRLDLMWDDSDNIDITDTTQYGFICEFESVEEPTPTVTPTVTPTATPTAKPTSTPTVVPTATPKPTATPTVAPTPTPTAKPTATPTVKPTATPTVAPTATPTAKPTATPTVKPTSTPTAKPTVTPTNVPTVDPTSTPEINTADFGYELLRDGTIAIKEYKGSDSIVYIPESIDGYIVSEVMGGAIFYADRIVLPKTIKKIEYDVFDISGLDAIYVSDENEYFSSDNGVLFNKDKTVIIRYPAGRTGDKYTIPDGVIEIGGYAFSDCKSLEFVEIPDSVKTIESGAFSNCDKISGEILLGTNVSVIEKYAFRRCEQLTNIYIPQSVTQISELAFTECSALENVITNANSEYFTSKDGVLFNKNRTELIYFCSGRVRDTYEVPDSVTVIRDFAFGDAENLSSLTIPNSVTEIGVGAFTTTALKDVYYEGSAEQWNGISIGLYNTSFEAATIHFKDGSYISPDTPIVVPTPTPEEEYVVVFIVDGKVIDTQVVKHGNSAVTPETPVKDADDECTYIFKEWDTKYDNITGDTVVTAIFDVEKIMNYTLGDVDFDGNINATDALLVLKHAAKISILTEVQLLAADTSKDVNINASDALLILKYAAKIIDSF